MASNPNPTRADPEGGHAAVWPCRQSLGAQPSPWSPRLAHSEPQARRPLANRSSSTTTSSTDSHIEQEYHDDDELLGETVSDLTGCDPMPDSGLCSELLTYLG